MDRMKPEDFVNLYTRGLSDFLLRQIGEHVTHVEDLMIYTDTFHSVFESVMNTMVRNEELRKIEEEREFRDLI